MQRPDGTTAGDLGPSYQGASENDTIMGTLGTATTVDVPCVGCVSPTKQEVRLTVTDQSGGTWILLAGSPADIAGWMPALEEAAGAPVVLAVLFRRAFQDPASAGFALSDDAGTIIAAETGPNLDTGVSVEGLSVGGGPTLCSLGSSCGGSSPDTISYRVFTTAAGSVTLGPSPDGEIEIGTRRYGARNLGGVSRGSCPGSDPVDSGSFWMVWREPLS